MKNPPAPSPQADGTPEPIHKPEPGRRPASKARKPATDPDPEDDHIGATEDQVADVSPPAGPAFEDEPKQG